MPIMVFFELFSNNPNIVRVEAGQTLFSEGDEGHQMFVLTNGEAEVIVNNRVVDKLQHGNIVGEMGIISPGPRSATVVATTDCEFVAVDEKRFHYLVQQTPFFATQVMRVLAERLRTANKMVPPIEDI
jgi:CRP-like cAMP-binding protein